MFSSLGELMSTSARESCQMKGLVKVNNTFSCRLQKLRSYVSVTVGSLV